MAQRKTAITDDPAPRKIDAAARDPRRAAGPPPRDAPAPNAAAHGSPEHVAAIDLLGRIEVEVARIERAMDPPLV